MSVSPRAAFVTAATAGLAVAAARVTPVFDPDYFWHLETGRWIVEHRAIPTTEPFSYTYPGAPWTFLDWLPEVVMHALHSAGGHGAVVVTFALLGGAGLALALRHAWRVAEPEHPLALVAVAALAAPAVVFRNTPRPQTGIFLLFAAMLTLLHRARTQPRAWWLVPPLVAAWQNVHNSAILAWLATLAAVVGDALDRRLGRPHGASSRAPWVSLAASALAMFACPHPLDRIAAGPGHLFDPRIAVAFDEWSPVWRFPTHPGVLGMAALALLALASAAHPDGRRPSLAATLQAAGFAVVAARTLRFVPIGALALAPLALRGLDGLLARARAPLGPLLAAALTLFAGAQVARLRRPFGLGLAPGFFPTRAVDFARGASLAGNGLHSHFDGGYILWALRGRVRLYADGRSLQVYPADFILDALLLDGPRVAQRMARYDSDLAILPMAPFVDLFQRTPGWSLVYLDDDDFVAVRDDRHADVARRLGVRALRVLTWAEDIARLRADPSARAEAEREALRLVAQAPDAALPRVLLATTQIAAGALPAADETLREALRRAPDSVPARRAVLVLCEASGDAACACRAARAVLARSPRNAMARDAIARHACP